MSPLDLVLSHRKQQEYLMNNVGLEIKHGCQNYLLLSIQVSKDLIMEVLLIPSQNTKGTHTNFAYLILLCDTHICSRSNLYHRILL